MTYKFDVLGTINMKMENETEIQNFINSIKDIRSNIIFDSNIDTIRNTLDSIRDTVIRITTQLDDSAVRRLDGTDVRIHTSVDDSAIRNLENRLRHMATRITVDLNVGNVNIDTTRARSKLDVLTRELERLQ